MKPKCVQVHGVRWPGAAPAGGGHGLRRGALHPEGRLLRQLLHGECESLGWLAPAELPHGSVKSHE